MNILQQSETFGLSNRVSDLHIQVQNGVITGNQAFEQLMEKYQNDKRNQAVRTPPIKKDVSKTIKNTPSNLFIHNSFNNTPPVFSSSYVEYEDEFDEFDEFEDLPIPNEPPPLPPNDIERLLASTDVMIDKHSKEEIINSFDQEYNDSDEEFFSFNNFQKQLSLEDLASFDGFNATSYLRAFDETKLVKNTPIVAQTRRLANRATLHKKKFDKVVKKVEDNFKDTCTFHPKINKLKNYPSKSREEVHDRLYRLAAKQAEELSYKRKMKRLNNIRAEEEIIQRLNSKKLSKEEESRLVKRLLNVNNEQSRPYPPSYETKYNFQPKINEKSKKISSKFMNTTKSKRTIKNTEKYTFQPTINEANIENNPCLRGYLKQNAFERLSKNSNTLKKIIPVNISDSEKFTVFDDIEDFESKKSLSTEDWSAFLTRQNQLLKDKERNRYLKHFDIEQEISYAPEITEMAKNVNNDLPVHDRLFSQAQTNFPVEITSDDINCTFVPSINENSRKIAESKGVSDINLYERGKMLQLKRNQQKETLETELLQHMPFEPDLVMTKSKYDRVKPTLRLDQDVKAYIFELNSKEKRKKDILHQKKLEEVTKQNEECTFHPEIHEAPEYVVDVVRELLEKRGPRTPLKYKKEWRS
eukprot:TRINITY_DN2438_c0_g1_i1.p1 TRINITY_DN2438_c0_g1~~TRINITY_DN2438_c0_g1_i1.p1  ORF type:complete len:640 (+),score=197.47 TRINITY_DN2438_c0_g1_i1:83-2002(+)